MAPETSRPGGGMIGIDTNILLRVFVDDLSRAQVEAARRLVGTTDEEIHISTIVLVESIWTLRRHFGMKKLGLLNFLQKVLDHAQFRVDDRQAVEDAAEDYRLTNLDFADCLIAALSDRAGVPTTFTFDEIASASSKFTLLKPAS
jgi:predicted nucleic-acid-binding protein